MLNRVVARFAQRRGIILAAGAFDHLPWRRTGFGAAVHPTRFPLSGARMRCASGQTRAESTEVEPDRPVVVRAYTARKFVSLELEWRYGGTTEGGFSIMGRKPAIALSLLIGLITTATPIVLSVYLAWKQSFDTQLRQVESIASDVLRRSEKSSEQVVVIFKELGAVHATDPCSDSNIRLMGKLELGSELVQAVGYIKNRTLLCSSFGRHNTPMGPPTYTTSYGTEVWASHEFPILPGKKFLVIAQIASGYSAAILSESPMDVFVGEPGVSLGAFSFAGKKLVVGQGVYRAQWMDHLGSAQQTWFSDGGYLVAIRRSGKYSYAAFAAIPLANVNQGLRRAALFLVPIGILASVVLALIVFYLAKQQLALPAVLKVALKRNEFFLEYQPIVDLHTGRWAGAEALIRWRRPTGEMVRPDVFVAVAEETGLIQRVTERVVAILGKEARQLFERHPDFHLAINLSAADLQSRKTIDELKSLAVETGARDGSLVVEATERGFMTANVTKEILREIRAMGVRTAIDDFGTGYSSLSYLDAFEVDYLKIDKSFVDTLGKDAATSQVVPHIIEMAKSLKLQMIAEGVETEGQAQFLREHGVQFAQGWHFARPMSFAQLEAGLSANKELLSSAG